MNWNRTIIVVDDEPETLKGYQEFLAEPPSTENVRKSSRAAVGTSVTASVNQKEKYDLYVAESGEKALEIFTAVQKNGGRVAAGFFDVKLEGGMDGISTILAMKKMDPALRCVVVTAYHDRSVDEMNQLFGEDYKDHWDYLNKPFTRGEIVQKARQMVAAWNHEQELSQTKNELIRSERLSAIGQVARGVGHEFGNILQRILGKADLALQETQVEKIRGHLQVILQATERAGVICRNLQSFSRNDPSYVEVTAGSLVKDAHSLVSHELKKSNIEFSLVDEAKSIIRVDRVRIGQVLLNLLINSSHAILEADRETGLIEVKTRDVPGFVEIEVKDNGSGISPENLKRIFDYAFTTKGEKGSGLGLSISLEIMEAMGGSVSARSELGKETVFTVKVPEWNTK